MKWSDFRNADMACFSLGSTCQTAYQLRRWGIRKTAGPLDWFVSESAGGLVRLIGQRFQGLMDIRRMELVDHTAECFVVKDNAHDILSFHDFPLHLTPQRWWEAYPAFKQTLDRRVFRFLKQVREQPVLFVRTKTTRSEAQTIHAALKTLVPGDYRLLIVNYHETPRMDVIYENWGLDGVWAVRMPEGPDWRGFDHAWDTCMHGLRWSAAPLRQH